MAALPPPRALKDAARAQKKAAEKAAKKAAADLKKMENEEYKAARLEFLKQCPLGAVVLDEDGTGVDSIGSYKLEGPRAIVRTDLLAFCDTNRIKYGARRRIRGIPNS